MAETAFGQLVRAQHWNNYQGFLAQFHRAAQLVADRDCDPRLANLTVSEKTFKRWLAGQVQTQPRPDVARVLEALFKQPVDRLFHPGMDEAPADADHCTETQVRAAARRALKFAALIDDLSSDAIQRLQAEAARLALAYTCDPLPVLVTDLANLQDVTFSLLQRCHRPDQLRDLYMIAALASGLMTTASMGAGDLRSAMTQADTALLCAQRAGHTWLAAKIISSQGILAYFSGQPRQAVGYARQAASLGPKGYVSILLPAMEARAHAVLGDREATLGAITRVHEAADQYQATDLDALGGIFAFPVDRQACYIAEARVLLDPSGRDAAAAADEAIALMAPVPAEDRYFVHDSRASAYQAITRVASGDLDAARMSLTPVLELPAERRRHTIVKTLLGVRAHIQARASRSPGLAGDLQQEIEQFARTGPPTAHRFAGAGPALP